MTETRADSHERIFFCAKEEKEANQRDSRPLSSEQSSVESEQSVAATSRCCSIRRLLPSQKNKDDWESSPLGEDDDTEEPAYFRVLKFLENRTFDYVFILACLLSIYLLLFSEGFLLESRSLWGIMHLVNTVYATCLFCRWLRILIKSKYTKTSHGYTATDIVYAVLSVFPTDLIVLLIFMIYDKGDNEGSKNHNPIFPWMITVSRLNYFLRIRYIMQYFSMWEDHLVIGDFKMFLIRTCFFGTFLIHAFACTWHRIACKSFQLSHFQMTPDEALAEVCQNASWIGRLQQKNGDSMLLNHKDWNVLATHYLVSVYWTIIATFRLGASAIRTTLSSDIEVAFVTFVEITAWVFVLCLVNRTLASLFIEKDTERQNFLTRCFAISHFMQFGQISKMIQDDVAKFYNYLWESSCGILSLDLIDVMPQAMKSDVFYDVNKFVLDQLPILNGLETPFLMSLSVQTNHRYYMSGEILYRKDETAHGMYYLVKGHLEVLTDDERQVLTTIRSGSAIGEIHLLRPFVHSATVRCGSDCEIRTLSRAHFKDVLSIYHQYIPLMQKTLETRLEQCDVLFELCERNNTYQKAFSSLRDLADNGNMEMSSSNFHSFDNVTKTLPQGTRDTNKQSRFSKNSYEITLSSEMEARLNQSINNIYETPLDKRSYEDALAEAYEALAVDVNRAVGLAYDLNFPRPPLNVAAPDTNTIRVTLRFKQQADSQNVFVSLFKRLRDPRKGKLDLAWSFTVSFSALLVCWYYPYQISFRNPYSHITDNLAHITDVIFALDCVYDMIQIVVTPQKTYERAAEVAIYRLKSFYFYLRIFSFLPLEYMFASLPGVGPGSPYFYMFKLNRLLEIHLVSRFSDQFEIRFRVKSVIMVIGRFVVGLFYVTHIFTVLHSFVKLKEHLEYRHSFYWTIVVVTSVGYGDMPSKTDAELTVEVLGLMVGTCTIIFLTAKVTTMLANGERKRASFQQNFYALEKFMKNREFSKILMSRVKNYYNLQWRAHLGTLIPTGHSVIWDAPKSVRSRVCHAQSHKYISRIPLFMHSPLTIQNEICIALKHYIIPPQEHLLHPNELARDMYIIGKGYVEVSLDGKRIAMFTEGRYFGLNGLLYGSNSSYMFTTMTHCQIFCLTHAKMMSVAHLHPSFLREIEQLTKETDIHQEGASKTDMQQEGASKTDVQPEGASKTDVQQEGPSNPDSELPRYPSTRFVVGLCNKVDPLLGDDHLKGKGSAVSSWLKKLLNKLKSFYLLPNGTVLKWWMGFRLIFAICVTIFVPIQLAFPMNHRTSFIAMMVFDAVAWFDILISFRIAYFGTRSQLVTNWWKIAKHYLTGAFLLDFLACFPADLIMYLALSKYDNFNYMYHVVCLLRLNRMLQCYKFLLTNGILEKAIFKSLPIVMMIEIAPAMFLFINLTTCLAVLSVCECSYNSLPIKCSEDSWIMKGLKHLNYDNEETGEELRSTFRTYFIAFYWVTQSVLSVGFGDIPIGTKRENQVIATVVIFVGVIMACYTGAKLTSCIIGEDPKKLEWQEKMAVINDYLNQQSTSKNLRRRVNEAFYNAWEKTNGVSPTSLFLALPPALKTDVMKQLYGATLKTSPLFENLDGPGIRMLAGCLQEIFFPEGEFLMKFGDLSNDVFFIAHGAVVCYNVKGIVMSQLGGGSIIGETASFFHTHRLYTAIAVEDVNAYVFKREHFMNFLNQYPHFKFLLEALSYQHYREAMIGIQMELSQISQRKTLAGTDCSVDNVSISFQNEKSVVSFADNNSVENFRPSPLISSVDLTPSIISGRRRGSKFVFKRSSAEIQGKLPDLTRNALKIDMLKNQDDLEETSKKRWWSPIVTFGRKTRDEMGLVHIYQELDQCNLLNFTVHPASPLCRRVSIYLILTTVSCGITTFEIAYERSVDKEVFPLFRFRNVLEIFFVFRIIGNFHLGYYEETGTIVTDVKTISKRYASRIDGLFLDLITTIPFYLLAEYTSTHVIAEYVRSLQLLRVYLFVRYLHETDSSLRMKASLVKVMKITILLCFIFHFYACTWYLVACYGQTCTRGSWMHKVLNELTADGDTDPNHIAVLSRYLLSLYYVTNALTATGFSHITARTNAELCLSIMMMFGTVFVIGYLVGEMTQCLASQVSAKIQFQHKLIVLEKHFISLGSSNKKILEIRQFFKLLWCRWKGVLLQNLVEELPYSLRADVAMEIYGPVLKSAKLFGKLDENLIRQLCTRIHHEIHVPGSRIIRKGDVCTAMYFIKKGEVVILDGSKLEILVKTLYENECFGEVKILLSKEHYRFSYVAKTESEVGVLHKTDMEAVLMNHPAIFEALRDKAHKVKAKAQSTDENENNGNLHALAPSVPIELKQYLQVPLAAEKKLN